MFYHFPLLSCGTCSHLKILIFVDPYFNFLDPQFRFFKRAAANTEMVVHSDQNSQDAPRKNGEPQTLRGLSIPFKILKTRAALRTSVGPWKNEALVWNLFTFEYLSFCLILIFFVLTILISF